MNRALLTDAAWGRTAVLLADDGPPVEIRLDRPTDWMGAIWLGRVRRVERGLGAFVDLGKDGTGLLASDKPPHEGAAVLVQATRPATADKGLALGAAPSLAGRYLIYTPRKRGVSVSKRLPDNGVRLQGFARHLLQPGEGVVVRAAAVGAGDAAIVRELDLLRARWRGIDSTQNEAPVRLWQEPDPLAAFLRDRLAAGGILLADRALRRYAERMAPPDARLEIADEPGWRAFGLEEVIQGAMEPVVALADGGSLAIEETRAGIMIDVDGGSRKDALALNLQAARTIAREVRLRGLGGLILVDFVDLDRAGARRQVERCLAEGFAGDLATRRQLPFSPLGVVEMTRQRLGIPLAEQWSCVGGSHGPGAC